ncbi:MAG: hypothetical protein ACTSO4_15930, partial [Promethearchaeota archaeon]
RAELLEFVNSSPSERFKKISKLIGLEDLEKQSKEFYKISTQISEHLNSIKNAYNNILEKISHLLGTQSINEIDILEKLNSKLSELSYPKLNSLDNIKEYIETYFKIILSKSNYSRNIRDFEKILDLSKSIRFNSKIFDLAQNINGFLKMVQEIQDSSDLELRKFLERGLRIIESKRPNYCPLCEQPINIIQLINNLNNRLMKGKEFSKKLEKFNEFKDDFKNQIEPIIKNLTNLIRNLKQIEGLENIKEEIFLLKRKLEIIIDEIIEERRVYKTIEMDNLKKLEEQLNEILNNLILECNERKSNLGITKEEKEALEILELLNKIYVEYQNLKSKENELMRIKRKNEIAQKIHNTFSKILKKEINEIFHTLANEINGLYSYLHPKDLHRNIRLEIDPNKRGSLVLKIDSFNREGQDPRALASEGHLDSLGICIFLSFVKKFNKSIPIIVLDDIITTIDANHRERLAKLLLTEFPEYQLIITTHDGLWFKQLIENQRALKVEHKWKALTIIDWHLICGPKFSDYKDLREKIQDCYNRGESDIAGFLTRRYLEWVLKKICLALKAEIEYKSDPKYTVKELFDSAYKRVNKLCKRIVDDENFKNNLKEKFTDIKSWTYLGNLLAHDNPQLELISTYEIKKFSNLVHDLYKCLTCPACGNLLIYNRDFAEIRCSKKNCKNPLIVKLKK